MDLKNVKEDPKIYFIALTFVNLLNYIDRGIIPGSTNEFNAFIKDDLDTDQPDVYLGLLQSSFIIGFSIAVIVFSNLLHYYSPFFICGVGLSIWVLAVILSGVAKYTGSYYFLLICRMLSGVGEASFQCSIPPWIAKNANPESRGKWLSIFFTAIPLGIAIGYAYSAGISESTDGQWQWAFFIEAFAMSPFVFFLFYNAHKFPNENQKFSTLDSTDDYLIVNDSNISGDKNDRSNSNSSIVNSSAPSLWEEFLLIIKKPIFLSLTAGYAAQNAALIGLSTFGSAFIISLGFFDTETEASSIFGVIVSIAGIVGTPLGGWLIDKLQNASKRIRLESMEKGFSIAKVPVRSAARVILLFSIIGVFLMCIVYVINDKWAFLLFICLGCTALFTTTTGINLIVMMAVPEQNRAFAIAFNSVIIHAFGDVPSPVIVGLLKDSLAPGCTGTSESESDDDAISSSEDCRNDSDGIRLTMLLISLWLLWSVMFFANVLRLVHHRPDTLDHLEIEHKRVKSEEIEKNGVNELLISH